MSDKYGSTDNNWYSSEFQRYEREKAQEVLDRVPDVQAYLIYADENGKDQVFATPGMKKLITTP